MAARMFNKADTTISFASKANFVSYLVYNNKQRDVLEF